MFFKAFASSEAVKASENIVMSYNILFIWLIYFIIYSVSGCASVPGSVKQDPFDTIEKKKREKIIQGEMRVVQPSVSAGAAFLANDLKGKWGYGKTVAIAYFTPIHGKPNLLCKRMEESLSDKLDCDETVNPGDYRKLKDLWKYQSNPDFESDYALPGFIKEAHYLVTGYLDIYPSDEVVKVHIRGIDTRTGEKRYKASCWLDLSNREMLNAWKTDMENLDSSLKIFAGVYAETDQGLIPVSSDTRLKSGQGYKIFIKTTEDAYLYIVGVDSTAHGYAIFPNHCPEGFRTNPIPANTLVEFPQEDYLRLDKNIGTEKIYIYANRKRRPDIEKQLTDFIDICERDLETKPVKDVQNPLGGLISKGPFYKPGIQTSVRNETVYGKALSPVMIELLEGTKDMVGEVISFQHVSR